MNNVGLHSNRIDSNRDNPREVAFAEQWEWENETGNILNKLIGDKYGEGVSERDRQVSATLMQWLGSNVGMSFIVGAIRKEPKIMKWLSGK